MNEQKKQKLLEQYDDAAFALLMDEYAETEGARLMAEFEAAQAAGQVPDIPIELDEQCRRMIRRDRAKKRGIRAARSFRKIAVKAAVAVLVFIGLMTTVVMSVDALRIPVFNYLLEHFDASSKITFTDQSSDANHDLVDDYLATLLPEKYNHLAYDNTDGLVYSVYKDDTGHVVMLDMEATSGEYYFDTEDAECREIILEGFDAYFIIKDSRLQMIWIDPELHIMYHLTATEFTEEEFFELCSSLAQYYK